MQTAFNVMMGASLGAMFLGPKTVSLLGRSDMAYFLGDEKRGLARKKQSIQWIGHGAAVGGIAGAFSEQGR